MRAIDTWPPAVDRIGRTPIVAGMASRSPLRHIDPSLIFTTLALAVFGLVMVHSATASKQQEAGLDPAHFLKRQLAYLVAGSVMLIVTALVDYRHLRIAAPPALAVTVALLVVVLSPAGQTVGGATRWIAFGGFQMQPSEFAKLAALVAGAAYLGTHRAPLRVRDVVAVSAIVAVPAVLIFLQPDLGTTMVFASIAAALLLLGGAKVRHFIGLMILGVAALAVAFQMNLVHDYQIERITSFIDPHPNVRTDGYNLTQSKIAIASGGLRGHGLHAANTQTSLDFVPEQHTDFIFTAVGEQLGFIGSSTLLGLFAVLIWRALRIAAAARDRLGSLVAGAIAALWAFQLFVNVGMTMGIMPITGIPLPFLSFGGSSLMTHLIAAGLLVNIHMRRFG